MDLGFEIIAVDFDGTLCENKWPDIGEANVDLISYLKKRQDDGDKLVLWTCRTGEYLSDAVVWCLDNGLDFNSINSNIREVRNIFGIEGSKIYADVYIDDKASNHLTMPFIKDVGKLSDGYHTFDGLYAQRRVLFATLCNLFKNSSWKSKKHSDGELCFGGDWFVVGIDTPEGSYTYHYRMEYWKMFKCPELELGKEWDGHTEDDVTRLLSLEQSACKCVTESYSKSSDHGGCKYTSVDFNKPNKDIWNPTDGLVVNDGSDELEVL